MEERDEIKEMLREIQKQLNNLIRSTGIPTKSKLRTSEACSYLGVSENTLRTRCIENRIYPEKSGGLNYYKLSDLDKILNGGAAH